MIHETTTTTINIQGKEEKKIETKVTEETVTVIERPLEVKSGKTHKISIKEKMIEEPIKRSAGEEMSATSSDIENPEEESEKEKSFTQNKARVLEYNIPQNPYTNPAPLQNITPHQPMFNIPRARVYQRPQSLISTMLNKIVEEVNESDECGSSQEKIMKTPNRRSKRQKRSSKWIKAIGSNGKVRLEEDVRRPGIEVQQLDSSRWGKDLEEEPEETPKSVGSDHKTIEIKFNEVSSSRRNPLLSNRYDDNSEDFTDKSDNMDNLEIVRRTPIGNPLIKPASRTPTTMNKTMTESKQIEPTPVTINVELNPANGVKTGKFEVQKTIGVPSFQSKVNFKNISARIEKIKKTSKKIKEDIENIRSRSNSNSITPSMNRGDSLKSEIGLRISNYRSSHKKSTPFPSQIKRKLIEIDSDINPRTPRYTEDLERELSSKGSILRNSGRKPKKIVFSSAKKSNRSSSRKGNEMALSSPVHPKLKEVMQPYLKARLNTANGRKEPAKPSKRRAKRSSHIKMSSMYEKKTELGYLIKPDDQFLCHEIKRFSNKAGGEVIASSPKLGTSQGDITKHQEEELNQRIDRDGHFKNVPDERPSVSRKNAEMRGSVFSQDRRVIKEQKMMLKKIKGTKRKNKSIKIQSRIVEDNTHNVRKLMTKEMR